jgi:asparagine synthase (glutamine-hydrolysing)
VAEGKIMSVQFGRWSFKGEQAASHYLDRATALLSAFSPDGTTDYSSNGVDIRYGAFHTTKESHLKAQPYVSPTGAVITWDGRLDNRGELIHQLGIDFSSACSDAEIVAAAYEGWGAAGFSKLVGDWALSIWNPKDRSLVLARDFAGTRRLYYTFDEHGFTWCTLLQTLVLLAEHSPEFEEEYVAGWLVGFPSPHLTPYRGISAVPPSSYVFVSDGRTTITPFWDFNPEKKIRYATDRDYEEHFLCAFRESVRRRLRSVSRVLAELSGGIDSSSIVCVADSLIFQETDATPQLHTISYFDPSEPNWDEATYFRQVEESRGRVGCHINLESQTGLLLEYPQYPFAPVPGLSRLAPSSSRQFADCVRIHRGRVLLSGLGGDEVLGGVPTPIPELADLLVGCNC